MSFSDGVILSATFASPRETSHARTSLRRLDVDQDFVPVGVLFAESGLNDWTWKRPGFNGDGKPNILDAESRGNQCFRGRVGGTLPSALGNRISLDRNPYP